MERQSILRGLSGERGRYALENKKNANKFDRRKQLRGNTFFIKGRKSVNLSKQPNHSCCLPYLQTQCGNHRLLRHLKHVDSVKQDE